jgi:hypothetical protein
LHGQIRSKKIVSQAGKESKGWSTQVQRAVGLAAELLCRLVKAEEEAASHDTPLAPPLSAAMVA